MGVKNLNSLLQRSQIYQDIPFKDSKLVVDGNNLAYHLYFMANLDQNHGGEYQAYQTRVKAFFNALADCGIRPYVVMDGGSGTSDIKLQTLMDRAKQKVTRAHDAALTGKKNGILPILSMVVFEQTLCYMDVPLAKCIGEADCELAALASEWRCPVLSKDSDFFIFNLPAGLLHLDHFQWDEVQMRGGSSYIPCKQYTTSRFCTFFNITPELLPVFASLAGNDYINLREVRWAQFLPAGKTGGDVLDCRTGGPPDLADTLQDNRRDLDSSDGTPRHESTGAHRGEDGYAGVPAPQLLSEWVLQ